jgi:hypothetical protein
MPAVRRISDLQELTHIKAQQYLKKSEPIVTKLYQLERKYNDSGMWEHFTSLVHDEAMANVFADRALDTQTHLGKDSLWGVWGKAQHADLSRRCAELPEDLNAARAEAMKFFTDQQNQMSPGIIMNRILKVLGINDDALAQRIHEGRTLDTDAAAFGEGGEQTLNTIKEAKELAKVTGPYFPLMRRGEYVVSAHHEIAAPANGTRLSDNEFEFAGKDARKKAIAFAQQQDTKPTIKSVWVDKNTGETHVTDDDGSEVRITRHDDDAEQRFRVTV